MSGPLGPEVCDLGNPLLDRAQIRMVTTKVGMPGGGEAGFVTFRSATTTLTALLDRGEVRAWGQALLGLADSMSPLDTTGQMPGSQPLPLDLRNSRNGHGPS